MVGDNQSVLFNSSKHHYVLNKKSPVIDYHREEVSKNEWRTAYVNTNLNPSGVCTKSLLDSDKRTRFYGYFPHHLD